VGLSIVQEVKSKFILFGKMVRFLNDAVNCSNYARLKIDECVLGTAGTTVTGRNEITQREICPRALGSALESVPGFRRER